MCLLSRPKSVIFFLKQKKLPSKLQSTKKIEVFKLLKFSTFKLFEIHYNHV